MRVFVRHSRNGRYYSVDDRCWVSQEDEAFDFGSVGAAIGYVADRKLLEAEVVLALENPRQDIVVPAGGETKAEEKAKGSRLPRRGIIKG